MSEHTAAVVWRRGGAVFTDNRYSRAHRWKFDGGVEVPGSSSPLVVPTPMSDASAVDPEEAFVASLSSCHMLWFLSIAAKRGYVVEEYTDRAGGVVTRNSEGKLAVTVVTLRPRVRFSGEKSPAPREFDDMHRQAHEECFIASSVKSEVRCEPVFE